MLLLRKGREKGAQDLNKTLFCLCLTLQDFSGMWCSLLYERVAIPHVSSLV